MKERYRRVPGEMSLSREWEGLGPEARFCWLQATVSVRQTSAGIYDGSDRALLHETGLSARRVRSAIEELAAAGVVRELPEGGYYVRDAFRWSAANPDFVKAAIRVVTERWPSLLPEFLAFNRPIFERFKVEITVPPPSPHRGTTVPPLFPHDDAREVEVAVAVPEPGEVEVRTTSRPCGPGTLGAARSPVNLARSQACNSEKGTRGNGEDKSAGRMKLTFLRKKVGEVLDRHITTGVLNDSYAVSVLWDVVMGRQDVEKARTSLNITFTQYPNVVTDLLAIVNPITDADNGHVIRDSVLRGIADRMQRRARAEDGGAVQ